MPKITKLKLVAQEACYKAGMRDEYVLENPYDYQTNSETLDDYTSNLLPEFAAMMKIDSDTMINSKVQKKLSYKTALRQATFSDE